MESDKLASVVRMLQATSLDELLSLAADSVLQAMDVTASIVYLTQPDGWLKASGVHGYAHADVDPYRLLPPDSPYPVAVAAREGRVVHQLSGDVPDVAVQALSPVSFAAFPLLVDGRCLGALLLEVQRSTPLPSGDYAALQDLASVCAHRAATLADRGADDSPASFPGRVESAPELVERRLTLLEQALTSGDIGAWEWYVQSGALVWDERICRIAGFDPRTFSGRIEKFTEAVHPDDRALVEAAVNASFTTGDYAAVHRVVRPDGAVRWVQARGKVQFDGRHRPVCMTGVIRDVTGDEERRRLVRAATEAFASALHVQDVADAMVEVVLPALACSALVVHVREGASLVLAAARGYPPETMRRLAVMDMTDSPGAAALRTDRTQYFQNRREYLDAYPAPELRPAPKHQAWAIVPLSTAQGPVGTCTMSYTAPHEFSDEERSQLQGLAGILAQSLARAVLFDQRRRQMAELQAMMLPRRLHPGGGVEVAVRYLPGTDNLDVGGDWYDVVALPRGRTAVVVGDVQGHNARAAAVMGQMRTAFRAYAAEGHAPSAVVDRTNRMLCGLDTDLFATACYTELDPAAGRATVVRAGHPNPLVLTSDGTCREITVPGSLPLGIDPEETYPAQSVPFAPGEALLLHTDGLVERRDRTYEEALAGLITDTTAVARDLVHHGAAVPNVLELLADHVVGIAGTGTVHDDIAVILAGHTPAGPPGVHVAATNPG